MSHVFVAMSGGVDSSVTALLLQQAGHQVSGINMQQLPPESYALCPDRVAGADAEDAQLVAERLNFPFHVVDLSQPFREQVIRYFVETYEAGETPNPCVFCNRTIKFGALLDEVLARGGDKMATGHYARIQQDPETGRYLLMRGVDRSKDQSYFLHDLTQDQLSRTLFPLGAFHKPEVRQLAEEFGLVNARKKDSQDICFVPNGAYASFIEKIVGHPSPLGEFLDENGMVLGQHKGFIRYTRGQHKGLGLPTDTPLYVLGKDPETCAIHLGPDSALWEEQLEVRKVNWISIPALTEPLHVTVKTRYSQRESAAVIEPLDHDRVHVTFSEPQRAMTPGQFAVFYDGEVVVGGGTIC